MGHKSVCINCKKTFNREFDNGSNREYKCPECGRPMILLPHRFRPPRKADTKKWETVKFLIGHGFYYQHIYEGEDYVPYPENLKDAKDFIEKYKSQARTINEAD